MMNIQLPPYKLKVNNLQIMRSSREILSDISFEVNFGEALLLRGANGVGKTSLLMALAGYLHIGQGLIDWQKPIKKDDERDVYEDMFFISHLHAMKENLSLRENLKFWAEVNGSDSAIDDNKIMEALEKAGLAHGADFDALLLSQGQKKRLSLARLLVSRKPIWLLDEPTAALDSEGDKWVASIIDAHLDAGGLIIAATHLDLEMKKNKRIKTIILGVDK